jgi:drug/metabolite transporter (DMT)-like permease
VKLDSLIPNLSDAKSHRVLASVLMLVTTFFWASNIVAAKVALQGFSALALAQLRMGLAAIIYWIIYVARRGTPSLHLSRRQWAVMVLMALCGITINQICYIGGIARTSVTHAGLIQAIGPVIVLALAVSLRMEPLTFLKAVGMIVCFTGVIVLLAGKPRQGSSAHWSGDVILIIAGVVFAYYTILMKEVSLLYDSLTLNAIVFALGAILLVPFCARSVAGVAWRSVPLQAWLGLAFMVLFGSLIAYLIYGFALQELAASTVASFSYLQPLIAGALGVWLLAERISLEVVLGGIVILAGVYITERGRGRQAGHMRHLATGRV